MKIERLSENYSKLELNQMQTIDELQEKVKLMEFDKTNDRIKILELKGKLKRKNKAIDDTIRELELINKNNFEKVKEILLLLKSVRRNK